jgi:O-antigen/teichoic acid export membrane protein
MESSSPAHHVPGSLRRRLAIGSSWLLGGNTLTTLLGVAQSLLLARVLGPQAFGTLAVVMTFTILVSQVFDARSWEAVVNFVGRYAQTNEPQKASATLAVLVAFDLGTALLAYGVVWTAASAAAAMFLKDPDGATLIRAYGLALLVGAPAGVAIGILRLGRHYGGLASLEALAATIQLLGVAVLLMAGATLGALVLWLATAAGLRSAALLLLARRASRSLHLATWRSSHPRVLRGEYPEITRFWVSTNGLALLKGLHQNLDTLFVGVWLGPAPAGIYRIARSLANLVAFPAVPLYQAVYAEVAHLWQVGAVERLRRLLRQVSAVTVAITALTVAILWLAAATVVRWTGGPDYLPAVPVMQLLMPAVALGAVGQYGQAVLTAARSLKRLLISFGVPLAVQLAGLVTLTPRLGAWGAAWSLVGYSLARALLLWWWGRRTTRIPAVA